MPRSFAEVDGFRRQHKVTRREAFLSRWRVLFRGSGSKR